MACGIVYEKVAEDIRKVFPAFDYQQETWFERLVKELWDKGCTYTDILTKVKEIHEGN